MDAITGVEPIEINSSLTQHGESTFNESGVNAEESSLGDKFFKILSDTKQEISEKTTDIENTLKVDKLTPVDLIRLQFEIAEITIQQELVSKGVSKSTQNVDTLLKAQ